MCGIIGYIGEGESTGVLTRGLRNLEYRGYDSVGVAVIDPASSSMVVTKGRGTVDGLRMPETGASVGIGHTRWSTHGEPTDENAHPHTDCSGTVAVVHNGIISNYRELKAELASHVFESETDTEIIPHLIEEELLTGASLVVAVRRVLDRLEGSFAIAVLGSDSDELVVARRDSPLVVGHGENRTFLGSDVTAFIDYTDRVTFLEDGDVALLSKDGMKVYNEGARVEREITRVEWDAESAGKAGYAHYMHKEIHEQPNAIRQTLSGRIDTLSGRADLDLTLDDRVLEECSQIQIVACGTSYHAGLCAKEFIETITDLSVTVGVASEYRSNGYFSTDRTLAIAVTQSGETADTLAAIRRALAEGMTTLAVTNTLGSTITREVEETIYTRAGPEIGVAATKTFLSQVATLTLLAIEIARARGTLSVLDATEMLESLRELPSAVQDVLDGEERIERLAREYVDSEAFFFIGRRMGYPVALESALKLKEISYAHAEGFPAGELKHGPLALVTPNTPVMAILTESAAPRETLNNVKEVEARSAPVIGVATIPEADSYCDHVIEIPGIGCMEPVVANVALQLFAYHVAKLKGRAIDKPRNLAKSVTVE